MDIFSTFTVFDWIVVSLVGFLSLGGLMRGFTHEALSLIGWILAIVVVRMFHEQATAWLLPKMGGEASAAIVAFLGLFFGTAMLVRLVAGLAGGFAKASFLGPMDRLLGFGFGALKGVIIASAIFLLTQFATGLFDAESESPEWLRESRSAPLLSLAANTMVGWVKTLDRNLSDETHHNLPSMGFPEGHPQFEGQVEDREGYSRKDREALEALLEDGSGDEVRI